LSLDAVKLPKFTVDWDPPYIIRDDFDSIPMAALFDELYDQVIIKMEREEYVKLQCEMMLMMGCKSVPVC
jgi:hypothetical protein